MNQLANTTPVDPDQRYTIPETAARLRVGRTRLYEKIRNGDLKIVKDGKRSFVLGSAILAASRG